MLSSRAGFFYALGRMLTAKKRAVAQPLETPLWERRVEVRRYLGRRTTLDRAQTIATSLLDRVRDTHPPPVLEARDALAAVLASTVAEEKRRPRGPAPGLARRRNAVLRALHEIARLLARFAAGRSPALAAQAKTLLKKAALVDLVALSGASTVGVHRAVERALGVLQSPPVRASLAALVPSALVEDLAAEQAALGQALDVARGRRVVTRADRILTAELNEHIDHFALCALSMAKPGDLVSQHAARTLLSPIEEEQQRFRRARQRKAIRKAKAAARTAAAAKKRPSAPRSP